MSSAPAYGHVARQASIRFTGLAFDKVLGYVFALFVAKTYGSTAFGLYVFGVGLFEIAYALTELGLERAVIRAVADTAARGRPAEVRGIVRSTLLLTLPFAIAVAVGVFVLAPWLAGLLGRPELAAFLQVAAVVVPASLVADAHLWATEGLGFQRFTVAVRMVTEPVVKVAIAIVLFKPLAGRTEAEPLGIAYAVAIVTSAIISYSIYRRFVVPRAVGQPSEPHAKSLLRIGLPLCGLNMLSKWLSWWDVFLIFTFVSSIATTHYAVAYRTALLPMMVASAFDAAFRPRIAAALAVGRRDELLREYQTVSRVVFTLCLPAVVMFVAFSGRVMPVIGDQFAGSAAVVAIVTVGTVASYLVGPASSALTMAGRSRTSLVNGLIGGAVGMAVGFSLVGRFGPIAAALGQASSMIVANGLHAVAARRVLGIFAIAPAHLRPALAAIAAALAGAGVGVVAPGDKYLAFAAVGTAVVAAYVGTLVALGFHTDDWAMLRGALRVLRRDG